MVVQKGIFAYRRVGVRPLLVVEKVIEGAVERKRVRVRFYARKTAALDQEKKRQEKNSGQQTNTHKHKHEKKKRRRRRRRHRKGGERWSKGQWNGRGWASGLTPGNRPPQTRRRRRKESEVNNHTKTFDHKQETRQKEKIKGGEKWSKGQWNRSGCASGFTPGNRPP